MLDMPSVIVARSWTSHPETSTRHNETSNVRVIKVQVSVARGVEAAQASTPFFSVEVESTVAQRLADLSAKENIPLKILASRLIAYMLLYHRKEVNDLITRMKHPEAW
jgi:hypothetical protein